MPVRGAKPKPEGQARHRNAPLTEWTDVLDEPFEDGPKLPRREGGWPAGTRRWWKVISAMPHCAMWRDADWQFAVDTAHIHAAFMEGERTAATELRIREKPMGVTLDARRDLRIRYVKRASATLAEDEPAAAAAAVTVLDDYRDLLAG